MFALKPVEVSSDGKYLQARFYWLDRFSEPLFLDDSTVRPSLSANLNSGGGAVKLWDCVTERKIVSGDMVVLRTEDPGGRSVHCLVWLCWR